MVIHTIQEDDAHGGILERPCRRQAAKSSTHDDDVRLCPFVWDSSASFITLLHSAAAEFKLPDAMR